MAGTAAPMERVVVQCGRRKLPRADVTEVRFDSDALRLPELLEVPWSQVALAEVKVRDHGQRLSLSLGSRDHRSFDFLRLEMPMTPQAAELLQLLRAQPGVHFTEMPWLLLSWPCSQLYGGACRLTEALVVYEVVNTTLELLFGFMLLTSLGKIFKSSGGGMLKSLQQLLGDLSELSSQGPQFHRAPLEVLRPYLGEESALFAAIETSVGLFVRLFMPARLLVYCAWHLSDLASNFLLVLLLLQHLLTAGYFLSRIFSTLRAVVRFLTKVWSLARRGLAHVVGERPPTGGSKRD